MSFTKENKTLNKYAICFLNPERDFDSVARMAYADMARHTLRIKFSAIEKENAKIKEDIRDKIIAYLKIKLSELLEKCDIIGFDSWHEEVCEYMVNTYNSCPHVSGAFTHGQAQKWLNMLIKYLYVFEVKDEASGKPLLEYLCGKNSAKDFLSWLHAPLDNKILNFTKIKAKNSWSKWGYTEYKSYQDIMRKSCLLDDSTFLWEIKNWSMI